MHTKTISLAVNALMAALVLYSWGRMALRFDGQGMLSARGLSSLKYFTVLSNLLEALTAVAYIICALALGDGALPRWLQLLRWAAATSVALTFMTVMAFLGPTMGYRNMFKGANLWFHLVVPLLAMLDVRLLAPVGWSLGGSLMAAGPALLYGLGYTANLLVNGLEKDGRSNDWYGFVRGGVRGSAVMFAVILLAAWSLAAALGAQAG